MLYWRADDRQTFSNWVREGLPITSLKMHYRRPHDQGSRILTLGLVWRSGLATAFHEEEVEVRGQRLGAELAHHHCDLTAMVS